jgi:hypothetical protein
MNGWRENWEIKMMAILLAVLLWAVLRMNHLVKSPLFPPPEVHQNG